MAYGKSNKSGSMNSPVGMCSHKSNPMKKAAQVSPMCGPGMNPDQKRANMLLQKAYKENDSLRGMSGM